MFARLTITQTKIERFDEALKIYEETVIPTYKPQKGFRGIYLLTDRKIGKAISIALWDSEDDAIANEQSGSYQEVLSKFKDVFAAPPVREGYEVSIQG